VIGHGVKMGNSPCKGELDKTNFSLVFRGDDVRTGGGSGKNTTTVGEKGLQPREQHRDNTQPPGTRRGRGDAQLSKHRKVGPKDASNWGELDTRRGRWSRAGNLYKRKKMLTWAPS